MIGARILADSIYGDSRLTTFECTMPKWLVAQFNTYGMVRRNSASSRAIPTISIIEQVERDPYMPLEYRYAQRGMVPGRLMTPEDEDNAKRIIYDLHWYTVQAVRELAAIGGVGMAKEDANRYLEPWMWTVVVATATEWDNFFAQRLAPDAQGAFQVLARAMRDAYDASEPVMRGFGGPDRDLWHLPYVTEAERASLPVRLLPALSSRRAAGVSYLRHGQTRGLVADLDRFASLVEDGHWSALEGACRVGAFSDHWYGPYRGWEPYRKQYGGESGSKRHGTQHDRMWAIRRDDIAELLAVVGGAV